MEATERMVKEFVDKLLNELDVGGAHYSPDLRDYLSDEREWLEDKIGSFAEEFLHEFR